MASLEKSLDEFKQKQEECHSSLTSIAEQNLEATFSKYTTSSPPNPSPAVKFSDDTERLQHIYRIRKGPVEAQLKCVIDLLRERRLAMDPKEINQECHVDINANKVVFASLKKNPMVNYDGNKFSYKPKHSVRNKDQLLDLIRKFPEGIAAVDLKDAYPNAMHDLEALKAESQIWLLSNNESQEGVAFPNDPKVVIKVDDDLKQLFQRIELPRDMLDVEKDLQKNGMKPATNTKKRKAMALVIGTTDQPKTKKKRRISKKRKLTNPRLPHLFDGTVNYDKWLRRVQQLHLD